MWKHHALFGLFIFIAGLVAIYIMGPTPNIAYIQKNLDDTEKLPAIQWQMLYEYDHVTGKGPKELLKLDGKMVRMPGYIVPLTDNYTELDEFILVPDAQACIHVPPPPPNLIVSVTLKEALPISKVSNPSWVYGIFKIESSKHQYGGSAYKMEAVKLEKFVYKEQ